MNQADNKVIGTRVWMKNRLHRKTRSGCGIREPELYLEKSRVRLGVMGHDSTPLIDQALQDLNAR